MLIKSGETKPCIEMHPVVGGAVIWVQVQGNVQEVASELNRMIGTDKWEIKFSKVKRKRSLDANGLYWKLLTDLASVLRESKPYMHNLMLRRYGQPLFVGEHIVYTQIPDTEQAEKEALEGETFHIKPTSKVIKGNDGVMYRYYMVLRGSSDLNSQEFSVLLDGLISECKEQGIPTLTPDEIEEIKRNGGKQ